jgi:hypothetical protein
MSPAAYRCPANKSVTAARTVLACAWPALLLATLCLLPFLNKAFVADDPEFLDIARQILKSPLHPMNFVICWDILPYCTKLYNQTPGNTLMGYALVPTVLSGAREWMAHISQLIFVWIAVVAMSSFVLRLGWSKRYAMGGALLLVAVPPLLPMASTAMADVLALAVGLVGMERLAAWKLEQKWYQGAVAALALGLAGIARAHLVLLLPLGAFFLLDSMNWREILIQIRHSPRLFLPVAAGALVLITVISATRERGVMLSPPPIFRGLNYIPGNLRAYLLFLCFPLPLAACWAVARWTVNEYRVVLMIVAATVLYGASKQLVLVVIGAYVLDSLLRDAWKNRDRQGLFLALWLLVPLPVVYYQQFPIKYLLPCLPAVILICFRLMSSVPVRLARTAVILMIVGGTVYSLLILRADAEFANFGRDALTTLIRPYSQAGETVWFPNEYSAYWYAPLVGAELIVPDVREPRAGDLLAIGISEAEADKTATLSRFPHSTLVAAVTHKYRFGRTMVRGASLYTNYFGLFLWTFRSGEDGRYELWRLN